MTKKLFKKW